MDINELGNFEGRLFVYNDYESLAFETKHESEFVFIYISGMRGYFFGESIPKILYAFCEENKYRFCQPMLQSHPEFGIYTLEDDKEDIENLFSYYSNYKIFLVGFSTGCQSIVYLMNNTKNKLSNVLCAVLIGAVSDREYEEQIKPEAIEFYINKLKEENNEYRFVYHEVMYTKERWCDLYIKGGRDDMFSSDLEESHFLNLNKKNIRMYYISAQNDEFMVKSNIQKLTCVPNSKNYSLVDAGHFFGEDKNIKSLNKIIDEITLIETSKSEYIDRIK